jgi:hypothetical protein
VIWLPEITILDGLCHPDLQDALGKTTVTGNCFPYSFAIHGEVDGSLTIAQIHATATVCHCPLTSIRKFQKKSKHAPDVHTIHALVNIRTLR